MEYNRQQECDFVFRTREILKQYESFQIENEKNYSDTLLINCLLGLLICPRHIWHDQLPTEIISEQKWGIDGSHISFIVPGEPKTVKNITIHLRNSASHYRFKILGKDGILDSIQFKDEKNGRETFRSEIPLSNLRKFALQLSKEFLDKMDNQQ